MIEVISSKTVKAKKQYRCQAWLIIRECLSDIIHDCTFAEKRAIAKAKQSNGMINIGDEYIRQFNKLEGDTYTWRAIPELHEICLNMDLYQS